MNPMNRPKITMTPRELSKRAQAWAQCEFSALPLSVVECYAEQVGMGKASCA